MDGGGDGGRGKGVRNGNHPIGTPSVTLRTPPLQQIESRKTPLPSKTYSRMFMLTKKNKIKSVPVLQTIHAASIPHWFINL